VDALEEYNSVTYRHKSRILEREKQQTKERLAAVTTGKHVNNTQAIARQLPMTTE
jgi:hypothetical protein